MMAPASAETFDDENVRACQQCGEPTRSDICDRCFARKSRFCWYTVRRVEVYYDLTDGSCLDQARELCLSDRVFQFVGSIESHAIGPQERAVLWSIAIRVDDETGWSIVTPRAIYTDPHVTPLGRQVKTNGKNAPAGHWVWSVYGNLVKSGIIVEHRIPGTTYARIDYDAVNRLGATLHIPDRSVPAWLRARVYERDGNVCQYCGDITTYDRTLDHVVPVFRGGTSIESNLVVACNNCNAIKGSYLLSERGMSLIGGGS